MDLVAYFSGHPAHFERRVIAESAPINI